MPDFWTHLIAGEEIAAGIDNKELKSLLDQNYQLFNYGCQGADFFFYKDFLPWQRSKRGPEKGEMVHSLSGRKLFSKLLTAYKKRGVYIQSQLPDSRLWQYNLVYLLGFISHYALDRECHPFIINNGGRDEKHKLIEASIDIYMMRQKWDQSPAAVNPLPYYQLQEDHFMSLNYYYKLIFSSIFGEELEKQLIWESYLDLRKYHKIFFAKDAKKYYLLKFLNLVLPQNLSQHSYALNEKEEVWPAENYQQFEKCYTSGIKSAQKLIVQTLNYLQSEVSLTELLALFSAKNFLGEESSEREKD
ncbi:zinc dependent phospholipase C [Halanaerobium saccharolyticum]|uniref:Zinc dependent phospholipase C n=1 Tax=Halanaerobium saccharolyticum TaxID=43595 RepID=A0A4R7Z6W5_9FIRM|nr:zinc dependent phospholipase C family protein [Halanaerobium saccharolyticum]RAK08620.1 zinc dependent phospholipase C [Halanaerobium saccharolyticum]TDW07237.1 zinc dependent phospholipase C [Halanaerobium saccharolyticum]TDX60172.1 zinc dependent phospholipase C [Halanaerobium saccharolyticum]